MNTCRRRCREPRLRRSRNDRNISSLCSIEIIFISPIFVYVRLADTVEAFRLRIRYRVYIPNP